MSELTSCNFCNLQAIRRDAKRDKLKIIKRRSISALGGYDIYAVPKTVNIPRTIIGCTENNEGDSFHTKYFVGWMMEIGTHCEC